MSHNLKHCLRNTAGCIGPGISIDSPICKFQREAAQIKSRTRIPRTAQHARTLQPSPGSVVPTHSLTCSLTHKQQTVVLTDGLMVGRKQWEHGASPYMTATRIGGPDGDRPKANGPEDATADSSHLYLGLSAAHRGAAELQSVRPRRRRPCQCRASSFAVFCARLCSSCLYVVRFAK